MMFPYDKADWSTVDGPMFMLAGTAWPGIFTAIAAVICVWVLVAGNRSEQAQYKKAEK
jgi:hypothetical protein|tara:strand:- start:233 stop:406 length:174 start_codon:yes stop_codon:yes gene_type:complete